MSLLERIEKLCNVDVDDASTEVIKGVPFVPHNQTSNQAIITGELLKAGNRDLLNQMVMKYGDGGWEKVYNMAGVHLCARNVPFLSGRVLLQTSLRHAHDRAAIIKQCHEYAKGFEELGVPRDRFAFKLPFTGAAASAARELNAEGIRTLATAVFSLEQAIAASQSHCLFISPYFNEIAAHLDESLRPSCKDPALEHPMSARVAHILEALTKAYAETGEEQPIMVIASHFTVAEILANAEQGCQHITISAALLKTLSETPDQLAPVTGEKPKHPYGGLATPERLKILSTTDRLAAPSWDGSLATTDTDYVADGGAKLDEFIRNDPVVAKRFGDANQFFLEAEDKARQVIEHEIKALGLGLRN